MQSIATARVPLFLIGMYAIVASLPSITYRFEDTQMMACGVFALVLTAAAAVSFCRSSHRPAHFTALHAGVLGYCGLALFSTLVGGEGYQPWLILSKYVALIGIFVSTAAMFRRENFPLLCHGISALLVILGVWALLVDFGLDQWDPTLKRGNLLRLHFGHQNALACFVVMALPFPIRVVLRPKSKLLGILAILGIVSATWLVFRTGSRNGVGTLVITSLLTVAGVGWSLRNLRPRILLTALCVSTLFVLLALSSSQTLRTKFWWTITGNTLDRQFLWKTAASVIRESPEHVLIGHGPGILYQRVYQVDYAGMGSRQRWPDPHAHNEYLEILMETGILGLLLCAAGGLYLGRQALRSRSEQDPSAEGIMVISCSLTAFAVFGLFSVATRGVIIQLWLVMLLGMAAAWLPHRPLRSRLPLIAIGLVLIPALLCIHKNFNATRHLLTAQIQTDQYGKPDPAATALALQSDPDNVDAQFMSLMVHAQEENLEAAQRNIEAIRAIIPRYKESEVIYAHALGFANPGDAAQALEHHLEVNRFAWRTRMDQAMYCLADGDRAGLENSMVQHFKALASWYQIIGLPLEVDALHRNGMLFVQFRRPGTSEIAIKSAEIPGLLWGRNPKSLDDSRRLIETNTARFLKDHLRIDFTPWSK